MIACKKSTRQRKTLLFKVRLDRTPAFYLVVLIISNKVSQINFNSSRQHYNWDHGTNIKYKSLVFNSKRPIILRMCNMFWNMIFKKETNSDLPHTRFYQQGLNPWTKLLGHSVAPAWWRCFRKCWYNLTSRAGSGSRGGGLEPGPDLGGGG